MFSFRIPVDEVIMNIREVMFMASEMPSRIPIIICIFFFCDLYLGYGLLFRFVLFDKLFYILRISFSRCLLDFQLKEFLTWDF